MTVAQGYIGRSPGEGRTIIQKQTTTVTAGVQTSFSMTAGYDLGYLEVYLNGTKQVDTLDFTADDGENISFSISTPPVQGDTLEFVAYRSFNVTNVTGSNRDFQIGRNLDVTGNVTIGSSLTINSDLVVNGTYTYVNTEILDVEDKTVGIASTSSPSNTTADGAGIVVYGGSDGDKSLTWDKDKANWILVGGGVSIGTGCTIGSSTANVLEFSVDGAVNAKLNNYGAFIVGDGVSGEAWGNDYKTVQFGTGALSGNPEAASAGSYWTNNAYFDAVNSRWEYIAGDEASRWAHGDGATVFSNAAAGSANGAITWSERLRITAAGDVGIGTIAPVHTGAGATIGNTATLAVGIITCHKIYGDGSELSNIVQTTINNNANNRIITGSGTANTLEAESTLTYDGSTLAVSSSTPATVKIEDTGGYQSYIQMRGNDLEIRGSSGQMEFYTGNADGASSTERLRITSAGLVGIGTINPQRKLVVSDDGTEGFEFFPGDSANGGSLNLYNRATAAFVPLTINSLDFRWAPSAGTEALRIDTGGRLLIGTTASRSANSAQGSFQIEGTGAEDSDMSIIRNQANSGGPALVLGKSRNASLAGNTIVQDDDQLGTLVFVGNDGTDLTSQGARIDAYVDGTPGSNDMPGSLRFATTADGAATTTERMRIDCRGFVGINCTPTDGLLHIQTASAGTVTSNVDADEIILENSGNVGLSLLTAATGESSMYFGNPGTNGEKDGWLKYYHESHSTTGRRRNLSIRTGGAEAMLISGDGVKIGTDNVAMATDSAHHILTITGKSGQTGAGAVDFQDYDGNSDGNISCDSGNLVIGADYDDATADSSIRFRVDGSSEKMRITAEGEVLIGATSYGGGGADPGLYVSNSGGRQVKIHNTSDATSSIQLTNSGTGEGDDNGLQVAMLSDSTAWINNVENEAMRFATNNTERCRIDATGDFLVNTDDSGTTLAQAGTILYGHGGITVRRNGNMSYWKTLDTGGYNSHVFLSANTTVGTIVISSGGTAFNTSSDYRLKENQVAISDGITRLKTLKPYRFNFKNNPSKTVDGFFAHEVTAVPEAITGTKDAVAAADDNETGMKKDDPVYQQIDQSKLVPLLTAALQEAITKIETLETKVAALESA